MPTERWLLLNFLSAPNAEKEDAVLVPTCTREVFGTTLFHPAFTPPNKKLFSWVPQVRCIRFLGSGYLTLCTMTFGLSEKNGQVFDSCPYS